MMMLPLPALSILSLFHGSSSFCCILPHAESTASFLLWMQYKFLTPARLAIQSNSMLVEDTWVSEEDWLCGVGRPSPWRYGRHEIPGD